MVAYTLSYFSASATAALDVSNWVPTTFIATPASLARKIVASRSSSYATKFVCVCASKYLIQILFCAREQVLRFFIRQNGFFYFGIRFRHKRIQKAHDFIEFGHEFGDKNAAFFWISFNQLEWLGFRDAAI